MQYGSSIKLLFNLIYKRKLYVIQFATYKILSYLVIMQIYMIISYF